MPVWWTYGDAVGQGHQGGWRHRALCVLFSCACMCVCWDESETKLRGLMRHAGGQQQKEVPALVY